MDACPACGATLFVVEVHGHGQCVICKTNIQPCCDGERNVEATNPSNFEPVQDKSVQAGPRLPVAGSFYAHD
jgi:hypothetical protein